MSSSYTYKQGQYLAFIYYYQKLNKRAPAFVDFQRYFEISPANANSMIKTLVKNGWIDKQAGQARSIQLLIERKDLPDLE